jgi:hypothetical protein
LYEQKEKKSPPKIFLKKEDILLAFYEPYLSTGWANLLSMASQAACFFVVKVYTT